MVLHNIASSNFLYSKPISSQFFKIPNMMQCPSCGEIVKFNIYDGINKCQNCGFANISYIHIIEKFNNKSHAVIPCTKYKINIRLGPHYLCRPLGLFFNNSPRDKFYPVLRILCKMKTDKKANEWYYGKFVINNETYYGFINSKYVLLRPLNAK